MMETVYSTLYLLESKASKISSISKIHPFNHFRSAYFCKELSLKSDLVSIHALVSQSTVISRSNVF